MQYQDELEASLKRYTLHPMKGIWEEDIKKFPNQAYIFKESGYLCEIKRSPNIWYIGTIYLPHGHPCYSTEKYPSEYLYKVFLQNGITDDNLYTTDIRGKITVKRDIYVNEAGSGSFRILTNDIGDYTPYNGGESIPDRDQISKFGHFWTYEEVKQFLEKICGYLKIIETCESNSFIVLSKLTRDTVYHLNFAKIPTFNAKSPEDYQRILINLIIEMEKTIEPPYSFITSETKRKSEG